MAQLATVETTRPKLFKIAIAVADFFRRKERTQELSPDFYSYLDFLEYVGFFQKKCFKGVQVIKDEKNERIRLKGHGDKFSSACSKCQSVKKTIRQTEHQLDDERKWDILVNNKRHVKVMLQDLKIRAKVCINRLFAL